MSDSEGGRDGDTDMMETLEQLMGQDGPLGGMGPDREDMVDQAFGFLDNGETPDELDDPQYMQELVPLIEDGTELDHPEDVTFLAYQDGGQMIYDAMTNEITPEMYDDAMGSMMEDLFGPDQGLFDTVSKLGRRMVESMRQMKGLDYMSEKVMGVTDASTVGMKGMPAEVEQENVVGYCQGNIESFADEMGVEQELVETYVKLHEGIHLAQFYGSDIADRREELKQELISDPFDDAKRDAMIALMSTVEGHAEYFTNEIFEEEYGEFPDRRNSWIDQAKIKAYGLEEKTQQYKKGSEFIGALYDEGGVSLANQALEEPPESMAEIEDPERWLERTGYAG